MKIPVRYEQEPMSKIIRFERKGDMKMKVDITFDGTRLSISGTTWEWTNYGTWRETGGGQNLDDLIQHFVDMPNAKRLYEIWDRWHLNDMNAGDVAQEAYLRRLKEDGWKYKGYDRTSVVLEMAGLNPHNGYTYGHAWKFEQVPEKIIEELRNM